MRRVTLTMYYVLSLMNLADQWSVTHVAVMTCMSLVYSNLSTHRGHLSVCLSVCRSVGLCFNHKTSNFGVHLISENSKLPYNTDKFTKTDNSCSSLSVFP